MIDNAILRVEGNHINAAEFLSDTQVDSLIKKVQTRGAAIIQKLGASSGMSAAVAIGKHLRDWLGEEGMTYEESFSMGIYSDGNPYGVPEDLVFSFPCKRKAKADGGGKWGEYEIVPGIVISDKMQAYVDSTTAELTMEKNDAMTVDVPAPTITINATAATAAKL